MEVSIRIDPNNSGSGDDDNNQNNMSTHSFQINSGSSNGNGVGSNDGIGGINVYPQGGIGGYHSHNNHNHIHNHSHHHHHRRHSHDNNIGLNNQGLQNNTNNNSNNISSTSTSTSSTSFNLFQPPSFIQSLTNSNNLTGGTNNILNQFINNRGNTFFNQLNNQNNNSNNNQNSNNQNNTGISNELNPSIIDIESQNINNPPQVEQTTTTTTTTTATVSNTTRLDLPSFMKWLEHSFPFITILFVVFLYKHRQGILVFLWQQIVFIQANQTLKAQVSLQDKRNIGVLSWLILILSSNIFITYLFFGSSELWRSLILLLPSIPIDIYSAFWVTILNDFIARFLTMVIKAFCIIVVGHKPPHKRRGQLYTVIEITSHLYRAILPTGVWFTYLHNLHSEGESVFGSLMVGLYFTFKLTSLVEKSKQWFQTAKAFVLSEVLYGRKATSEQISTSGDLCAICQEKMVYGQAIILRCDHVFCEDCVSQWFEREKTCPLCRAAIATAGNRTHSDGTTSLLLQLF